MPQMANITIKDSANADVTFSAATPSAGDRSPAKWMDNAASGIIGLRPQFSVLTRDNSRGNGRVFEASGNFPIIGLDTNGNDVVLARVPLSCSGTLPTNVSASDVSDAYVQFAHLLASALIKQVMADGYAPT